MKPNATRWQAISDSNFQWEREALDWLRAELPDRDPWHVWSNFEFIDDEGKVNEVDALVLSPAGLFLVEIKSRPGVVDGDTHTWTWTTDGRDHTYDNPLLLTDRKSKRLASLLRRQPSVSKAKIRLPFIQPVVFLSSTSLRCKLSGLARTATYLRGQPSSPTDDGIVAALRSGVRQTQQLPVDGQQSRAIARGVTEAGIRPSNKHRQVSDYKLGKLLEEGDSYQDWDAQHVSVSAHRRIRIYTVANASSPEVRAARTRLARREFEVLEGIDHPGILKVKEYKEVDLGAALIFDHDPKAQRLDHLLRDQGTQLTLTQRLHMVRSIAETLAYAHANRVFHRALCPQSILVQGMDGGSPQLKLMNWQTASRNASDSASPNTVHRTTGTRHVEDYVEAPGLVYLAPETAWAEASQGASLDVFSLGCIAYHVFSGQPPAASVLELTEKLRVGQGLRLSDVLDGAAAHQQDLVQFATCPDVHTRYGSMKEFLAELEAVEDELTTPDPAATVDPSIASAGDRLEGGFTVVKRMGRGSTGDVLLVTEDDSPEEHILKVACAVTHNDRLVAEGEALDRLHHQNIVGYRRTLRMAGRTALLLKGAGAKTLAELLKEVGRLSLDMLQRFGEELIEAVIHLEAQGVAHRDIKPDNIGISTARTGKLQLVLFDFSLSRTPPENITAGTHPYLDPFLSLRRPPRWDLSAERYAVAVTLYQMAVGQPPLWGDGQTSPAMLDVEATIESEVFDPAVREGFNSFFGKALKRDFKLRFDNAEEMLHAWRAVFANPVAVAPADASAEKSLASIAPTITPLTNMAELGYSLDAQVVLERMGVHNVRELLAVNRRQFRYLRGVGDKIRKEVRRLAKELAGLRPDLTLGRATTLDGDDDPGGLRSVDALAGQLLPRRPAGDDRPEDAALAHYLGLDDATPSGAWPTLGDSAQAAQVSREVLTASLVKSRERWLKNPVFTELRAQLHAFVVAQGKVTTAAEAALSLLATRGSAEADDNERLRLACAVLRAAVEAEAHLDQPRFQAFDHPPTPLIATAAVWADYARQLGIAADTCADDDPLRPPARALHALERVQRPDDDAADSGDATGISPWSPTRVLRLATAASHRAALSSRQEIYPRGMPALQALRQSIGALVGAPALQVRDLQLRVRGRYPEAAPLPGRPELDHLLDEAGAPLQWDPTWLDANRDMVGAYRPANAGGLLTSGNTTHLTRHPTGITASAPADTGLEDARAAEERLQRHLRQGGLLVLTAPPRIVHAAESELLRRFGHGGPASATHLQRLSFDALMLQVLRAEAEAARIDWNLVLRADAARPQVNRADSHQPAPAVSRDWVNLMRLVQRCMPALRRALLHSPVPLLLVNTGLLPRYELMPLVSELEAAAGRPGHTPAVWLLLPAHQQGLPMIDGTAVPLVNNLHKPLLLPKAWIENHHRARVPTQSD